MTDYFGYVCFILGFLTGLALWYYHDLKDNPYLRGFQDGYDLANIPEKEEKKVDAVPVRHGKWIPRYIKIAGQDYKHGMKCSMCAEPALDVEGDDYLTDYCPWCGARMDEE